MNSELKTSLTPIQKLHALSLRYYSDYKWEPEAGDYYTTCRSDLELYRIAKIENGIVYTEYTTQPSLLSEWSESEFTTAGFGIRRVHVPSFIFGIA